MRHITNPSRSRGIALVYIAVSLPVFVMLVSLGVDFGRVQVAKFELRRCADAAARYALQGISDGTWLAKAQAAAQDNAVDGSTYYLAAGGVTIGNWNGTTFIANGTPNNAISITVSRTAAAGNAVPLVFGMAMGRNSCDIHATAIGYNAPSSTGAFGLVGVSSMSFSSGARTDSYNSSIGAYSAATATHNGSIGSNGTVSVSGSSTYVDGNVFCGPSGSGTISTSGNPTITGTQANGSGTMSYAATQFPASGSYYDVGTGSFSGTYNLGGGTYMCEGMTLNNASVYFSGAATVYINGAFNGGSGGLFAYGGIPGNLKIIVLNNNPVTFTNGLTVQADFYGPGCNASIASGASLYGRVIANTINANGGSIHYDTSLPAVGTSSFGTNPELVK